MKRTLHFSLLTSEGEGVIRVDVWVAEVDAFVRAPGRDFLALPVLGFGGIEGSSVIASVLYRLSSKN